MFKKLKDKIAEEVKISPQRMQQLQQFTQSVTDKLQQTGAPVPDDGLFSISEDDCKQADAGFTNVPLHASAPELNLRMRRNSNSSIASDVSFLPRYEPSMNSYHLQSDLEVSASEMEDNASMQSSQMGHVSKEQVHIAFQKAQMRYHKYRGRYTDLANHYKELERENAKMKAVLVETQDKAIRRVSELKEQCTLSQRAKADLESALRTEIEEKSIVIDTLKQKIALLQGSTDSANGNSPEVLTNGNSSNASEEQIQELQEKLQEFKANSIISKDKVASLQRDLDDSKRLITELEEREKQNNLKFAKSKMDLHTELQNRDLEITNLKQDLETVKHDLDAYEKGGSLKTQNTNLIEKCDSLKSKCHEYEAELLKIEQYKIEIEKLRSELREQQAASIVFGQLQSDNEELKSKITDLESYKVRYENLVTEKAAFEEQINVMGKTHQEELTKLQEETKHSLVALQEKIRNSLCDEFQAKEAKLKDDFNEQLKMLERDGDTLKQSLVKLLQAEEMVAKMADELNQNHSVLDALTERNTSLESNYIILMEENNGRQTEITSLTSQLRELEVKAEEAIRMNETISVLENDICEREKGTALLQNEIENLREEISRVNEEKQELEGNMKLLQDKSTHTHEISAELSDYQTKYQREQQLCSEIQQELDVLKSKLEKTSEECSMHQDEVKTVNSTVIQLQESIELLQAEKIELQQMIQNSEDKIHELEEQIRSVKDDKSETAKDNDNLKHNLDLLSKQHKEFANSKLAEIEKLTSVLQQEQKSTQEFKDKLELNEKLVQDQKIELQTLREQFLKEKEELIASNLKEIMALKATLEDERAKLQRLYQQLHEKDGELNVMNSAISVYREMKEESEQARDDFERMLEAEKDIVTSLTLKIQLQESAIIEKDKQVEMLQKELEIWTKQNEQNSATTDESVKKLMEENRILQGEISTLREEIDKLVSQHSLANEKCSKLSLENTELNNNLVHMTKTIETLQESEQNVKASLENCVEKERQWLDEKSSLEKSLSELSERNGDLTEKCKTLECRLADVEHDMQNSSDKERADLHQLQEHLHAKQTKIDALETQVSDIQKQVAFHTEQKVDAERLRSQLDALASEKTHLDKCLKDKELVLEAQRDELAQVASRVDDLRAKLEAGEQREEALRSRLNDEIAELQVRNDVLSSDNRRLMDENDAILSESSEIKLQLAAKITNTDAEVAAKLSDVTGKYTDALEEARHATDELSRLRAQMSTVDYSRTVYEKQLHDLEKHVSELEQERQFLKDEIEELKTAPVNVPPAVSQRDYDSLQVKLAQYKSIDQTNRSSIEFYENELQKLQSKNEKLNRKLDETLVTLNHCADLSASTEVEYLKNVLYNYMLGKESMVLARVIAAVCKFDRQQTDAVLKHEQHKQTLLGQLGIL